MADERTAILHRTNAVYLFEGERIRNAQWNMTELGDFWASNVLGVLVDLSRIYWTLFREVGDEGTKGRTNSSTSDGVWSHDTCPKERGLISLDRQTNQYVFRRNGIR